MEMRNMEVGTAASRPRASVRSPFFSAAPAVGAQSDQSRRGSRSPPHHAISFVIAFSTTGECCRVLFTAQHNGPPRLWRQDSYVDVTDILCHDTLLELS